MINTPSFAARTIPVRNPRSGEQDATLECVSSDDLAATAAGLRVAQPAWADAGVEHRIAIMQRFAAELGVHREAIAAALAVDTGRIRLAGQEVDGTIGAINRWCGLAPDLLADTARQSKTLPHVEINSDSSPFPVLGAISPWNFPLLLSFIDVTPALLAGCAALVKPSEVTPRFIEPLEKAIKGVPELAEVLRFVRGDGQVGAAIPAVVDVVAFTGSVATGKKVAAACAEAFIPAFLELGGKDAAIVLEGYDVDRATTAILRASIAATGQACQSLERIYVHDSLHDEFVKLLATKARAAGLTRDDPAKGIVGPLIFAKQGEIIREHLADALARGAEVVCGGEVINDNNAWWIEPTVIQNVDHSMAVMTEETFGPIMPVMRFTRAAEAIVLANDSQYGLSGAVMGPNEEEAIAVAREMNAGGVTVNDAGLTTMIFETEKSAFACSGMGPSRVGASGLTRFLRRKSLFVNRGEVFPIHIFSEQE